MRAASSSSASTNRASTNRASKMRVRAVGWLLGVLLVLTVAPARADKIADAEDLFRRAKALMALGKFEEACPMLKESYRSDPAPGTLLNLALCHEQIGKTASAWGEFRVVEQQSRAATPPREDRMKLAREHAEKLEPRLSRIRLVVPPAARAPGLVIKVDGEEKGEMLWSAGIVVDPGTRALEASAPKKKTAVTKVKIDDEGVVQDVTLAPLDDAPAEAAVAPAGSGADLASMEAYAASRARRTTGYVVGGIGVVVLATGATFGIAAIINNNDAKSCGPPCYNGPAGTASNQATDRALVFANVANVTVPLGLVAAGIGTYLLLTAGEGRKVSLAPGVTTRSASLDVSTSW